MSIPRRPMLITCSGTYRAFDVEWSYVFGTYNGQTQYAFIENGPLCPNCKFEMDSKEKSTLLGKKEVWFCVKCGNEYDTPKGIEDTKEVVSRLIEADFRKKGSS